MKQGDCRKVVSGASVLTMHQGEYVKRQQLFEHKTREFGKSIGKINVSRML